MKNLITGIAILNMLSLFSCSKVMSQIICLMGGPGHPIEFNKL